MTLKIANQVKDDLKSQILYTLIKEMYHKRKSQLSVSMIITAHQISKENLAYLGESSRHEELWT